VIAAVNGAAFGGGCDSHWLATSSMRARSEICAHRDDARHHARLRRDAEPAASRGRKAREGTDSDRARIFR